MHASTEAALLAAIRAELQANPATYAGKSAAEITALMNDPQQPPAPPPQPRAFLWRAAKAIAQTHGRWPLIVLRARATPASPPATAFDLAILAAINAVSMADEQEIDPTHPEKWAAFLQGLGAFVAAGDLTQSVADEIEALGSFQPPQPPPGLPRWVLLIDGLGGVGNDPGPPNLATADMIAEALGLTEGGI